MVGLGDKKKPKSIQEEVSWKIFMPSEAGEENTEPTLDVTSHPRLKGLKRHVMQEVSTEWICEWTLKCFQGQKCNNMPPKIFGDTLPWVNTSCRAGWEILYAPEVSDFS